MKSTIPTVIEVENFRKHLIENDFAWKVFTPQGEHQGEHELILKTLVEIITHAVDEVLVKDDGSIWAKPGVFSDGTSRPIALIFNDLHDRTQEGRPVRDGHCYRLSRSAFGLIEKIALSTGGRTHSSARHETARILNMDSVDHVSFAFYHAVRRHLFEYCPIDDHLQYELDSLLDYTLPGLSLPELTGYDHPKRKYSGALHRAFVIRRLLRENPKLTAEDLTDEILAHLTTKTNVFWWIGFDAECLLKKKLEKIKKNAVDGKVGEHLLGASTTKG